MNPKNYEEHDIDDDEEYMNKTSVSAVASNDRVIKPCPFCGEGEAAVERKDGFDTYVYCVGCGARGERATGQHDESVKVAIYYWNQRAL